MILPEGLFYLLFAAISLLSASAGIVLTGYLQHVSRRRAVRPAPSGPVDSAPSAPPMVQMPRSYAFREGRLVSDVDQDDPFLAPDIDRVFAPLALEEAMATLHPDLPDRFRALLARGDGFFLIGYLGPDALSVLGRVEGERCVVTVAPADDGQGQCSLDHRTYDAIVRDSEHLHRALGMTGAVQWKENGSGQVIWGNAAYLGLCRDLQYGPTGWPLDRVFTDQLEPPPPDGSLRRCQVTLPRATEARWFEAAALRLGSGETLFSARPIDRLVAAEAALRDFVQTLSKTFANLPIALAVFDRKRELVLFNPALVSISTLDPGFLSGRPSLRAFLDQLREMRRMPEPRDYRAWRDEIARLEQGAAQDRYHELWTLPSGESLRVTGRPHPNGALAFMFEDISQEISLTRRFRTDRDLDRSILDDMAAALIVFDREGRVLRTNAAYEALFPGKNGTLVAATSRWQDRFDPNALWGEIRQFALHEVERAPWSEQIATRSGPSVTCRVAPLPGGLTIVWFIPGGVATDPPNEHPVPAARPGRSEPRRNGAARVPSADEGAA